MKLSVYRCHSSSGPDLWIFSDVEVSGYRWIAQKLSLGQQTQRHLLLISGVHPKNSIRLWFAGLRTSRWNLCFAVAPEWVFTCFLRKIFSFSLKISQFELLMFLNVCSAMPHMREWKYTILFSYVNWLWVSRLVWNTSSNGSIIYDFPSKVGIVVVRALGNFEIRLMLLKLAELLLLANCWRANTIWSASIVEKVFSLVIFGWHVERASFFFLQTSQWSNKGFFLEILSQLIDWGSHFRMGIILGTSPIWLPTFNICFPGCPRNGSGVYA